MHHHEHRLFTMLLVALTLLCSGCNYKELDDNVQDTIQQIQQDSGADSAVGGGMDASGGTAPVYIAPLPEDQIEYRGIGESFSAYKKYTVTIDGYDDIIEKGNEGLTYTLRGVTVYDSIYDAGVDMYGCMYNGDFLDKNAFILINIQASYVAPENGAAEIIAFAHELSGAWLEDKITPEERL